MTLTVDDLIATAKPRTLDVPVCARGDLVDRHAELVARLNAVIADANESKSVNGEFSDPEIDRLHDEIVAVEAEQETSSTTFTLRSIGSLKWANLLREHTPRPGRDHQLMFNLTTFPPAAVAACVVEPPMSLEQATKLYGTDTEDGLLHHAEWDKLFAAAFSLNENETPHPKLPAAIGGLLRSVRSSTTAANGASPEKPSSDDSAGA